MPSLTYPAVVIETSSGCFLAPRALFITWYCRRPCSPCHAPSSSQMTPDGLKPSLFFSEKAIGIALLFVSLTYRSVRRFCVISASSGSFRII